MAEMFEWVKYSWSVGFKTDGRARRREFWWNFLFWELVSIACSVAISVFGLVCSFFVSSHGNGSVFIVSIMQGLSTLVSVVIGIIIMLPLYVRRLHDIGLSGWIYLACIVGSFCCCIGCIVLLVLMCQDSQPGDNMYGPNPKQFGGTMPGAGGLGGGYSGPY